MRESRDDWYSMFVFSSGKLQTLRAPNFSR